MELLDALFEGFGSKKAFRFTTMGALWKTDFRHGVRAFLQSTPLFATMLRTRIFSLDAALVGNSVNTAVR